VASVRHDEREPFVLIDSDNEIVSRHSTRDRAQRAFTSSRRAVSIIETLETREGMTEFTMDVVEAFAAGE